MNAIKQELKRRAFLRKQRASMLLFIDAKLAFWFCLFDHRIWTATLCLLTAYYFYLEFVIEFGDNRPWWQRWQDIFWIRGNE